MKTEIFVMTHKKFDEPDKEGYIPLHVGRALGQKLGYMGDDSGDNISDLNPYFGELTGLYWLWRNYHNIDIIGICHYRRYFLNENRQLMSVQEYEEIMQQADVLVSNVVYGEKNGWDSYAEAHNRYDIEQTGEVIKELYPEDYEAFCRVMDGNKSYYGNLCVMRKELFDSYCEWLFSIFGELEGRIDVSQYDNYRKRVFGFISEILLMVYIQARDLKVREGIIGVTSEKAETVEFKLAMRQLVKKGQFGEARKLFYDYQKLRPDIRLQMSDIRNEIPDIELIL